MESDRNMLKRPSKILTAFIAAALFLPVWFSATSFADSLISIGMSGPAILTGAVPGTPEITYVNKLAIKSVVPDQKEVLVIGWVPKNIDLPIISYNIYKGATPDFVPDSSNLVASTTDLEYRDPDSLSTGTSHYYRITAVDAANQESNRYGNMAYVAAFDLAYAADKTNLYWISIPYVRPYTKASDLTAVIPNCAKISRFNPYSQLYETYELSAESVWQGTDFDVIPGEAAAVVISADSAFSLIGAHYPDKVLNMTYHVDISNINWVSLPYNATYLKASDIASELSGATRISRWNANSGEYEDFFLVDEWIGNDFAVNPKEGIAIVVNSDVNWKPSVIAGP